MDAFHEIWEDLGKFVYKILPLSPFQPLIQAFSSIPYLSEINWFFPIGDALEIMGVWLSAITAYFMWQWILRWVRVVA